MPLIGSLQPTCLPTSPQSQITHLGDRLMRVATELNKKITSEPSPNAVSSTMDDEEGADGALQVVGPYNKPAKNSQMIILFSKI